MAVPAGAYPGAPQGPAPQPSPTRKSNAGLVVGALVIVGALAVGGVVLLGKQKHPSTGAEGADAGAATAAPAVDAGKPPAAEDAGGPPIFVPATDASHPHPHDRDCNAAKNAASHNNVDEAVKHLKKCEGPLKDAAEKAVAEAKKRCPGGFCNK
jgi:hypothetical protein